MLSLYVWASSVSFTVTVVHKVGVSRHPRVQGSSDSSKSATPSFTLFWQIILTQNSEQWFVFMKNGFPSYSIHKLQGNGLFGSHFWQKNVKNIPPITEFYFFTVLFLFHHFVGVNIRNHALLFPDKIGCRNQGIPSMCACTSKTHTFLNVTQTPCVIHWTHS